MIRDSNFLPTFLINVTSIEAYPEKPAWSWKPFKFRQGVSFRALQCDSEPSSFPFWCSSQKSYTRVPCNQDAFCQWDEMWYVLRDFFPSSSNSEGWAIRRTAAIFRAFLARALQKKKGHFMVRAFVFRTRFAFCMHYACSKIK